ncbi:MAG: hypothetical protein JXQ75_19935 [Phycisphaerae bacterium]|nr:hypothetical protein [Phycisphaerae bacterium]
MRRHEHFGWKWSCQEPRVSMANERWQVDLRGLGGDRQLDADRAFIAVMVVVALGVGQVDRQGQPQGGAKHETGQAQPGTDGP